MRNRISASFEQGSPEAGNVVRKREAVARRAWPAAPPTTGVPVASPLSEIRACIHVGEARVAGSLLGAVSGKLINIGRTKTATTAIMAPGTMIQPVRSVRTWAT